MIEPELEEIKAKALAEEQDNPYAHRIFTIPNVLTFFRILLIPVFIWVYMGLKNTPLAIGVLLLSSLTDLADGYIARHFHMVSELGKALDPVADKLNQAAALGCLVFRYPIMLLPLGIMVVKEITLGILMLKVIKRSSHVFGADWHGKAATVLIYTTMALHLVWPGTAPTLLTYITVGVTAAMQLLSFVIYFRRNTALAKQYRDGEETGAKEVTKE